MSVFVSAEELAEWAQQGTIRQDGHQQAPGQAIRACCTIGGTPALREMHFGYYLQPLHLNVDDREDLRAAVHAVQHLVLDRQDRPDVLAHGRRSGHGLDDFRGEVRGVWAGESNPLQPIDGSNSEEAKGRNRRIELKLTER